MYHKLPCSTRTKGSLRAFTRNACLRDCLVGFWSASISRPWPTSRRSFGHASWVVGVGRLMVVDLVSYVESSVLAVGALETTLSRSELLTLSVTLSAELSVLHSSLRWSLQMLSWPGLSVSTLLSFSFPSLSSLSHPAAHLMPLPSSFRTPPVVVLFHDSLFLCP